LYRSHGSERIECRGLVRRHGRDASSSAQAKHTCLVIRHGLSGQLVWLGSIFVHCCFLRWVRSIARERDGKPSRRPVEFALLAIAETIQRGLVRVRLHLVATAVVTGCTPDDQQYRHASSVEQLMPLRIGL